MESPGAIDFFFSRSSSTLEQKRTSVSASFKAWEKKTKISVTFLMSIEKKHLQNKMKNIPKKVKNYWSGIK
jgi:hypothetical protein